MASFGRIIISFQRRDIKSSLPEDDIDALRVQTQNNEHAAQAWRSWAEEHGSVVELTGDSGVLEIDAEHLDELPGILLQYKECVDCVVSVGVGMKLSEAQKALRVARHKAEGGIVLYTPEVDDELEEMNKEKDPKDNIDKITEQFLNKADPALNQGEGAGISGQSTPAVPSVAKPKPEGSEHSEGERMNSMLEEAPGQPEQTNASADLEDKMHEMAQAQDEQEQQQPEQASSGNAIKAQVVQVLQQVRQAAPILEQMAQSSPEVYEAVMNMTRAVISMARELPSDTTEGAGMHSVAEIDAAAGLSKAEEDFIIKAEALLKAGEFREAGFRHKTTGQIVGTGPFHDVEQLPNGVIDAENWDDGFVDHQGKFYTRMEAANKLKLKAPPPEVMKVYGGDAPPEILNGLESSRYFGEKQNPTVGSHLLETDGGLDLSDPRVLNRLRTNWGKYNQKYAKSEANVPYGWWLSPEGELTEVDTGGHLDSALQILRQKYKRKVEPHMGYKHLHDAGYVRLVHGGDELGLDTNKPITDQQTVSLSKLYGHHGMGHVTVDCPGIGTKDFHNENWGRIKNEVNRQISEESGATTAKLRRSELEKGDLIPLNPPAPTGKKFRSNAKVYEARPDFWEKRLQGKADVGPQARPVVPGIGTNTEDIFDYSHHLPQEMRDQGYTMSIKSHNDGSTTPFTTATLHHGDSPIATKWAYSGVGANDINPGSTDVKVQGHQVPEEAMLSALRAHVPHMHYLAGKKHVDQQQADEEEAPEVVPGEKPEAKVIPFPVRKAELQLEDLTGGLSEGKKLSDFNPKAIAKGVLVELEHTDKIEVAVKIAMDHLTEDPKYYEKLAVMEGENKEPMEKKALSAAPGIGRLPKAGAKTTREHLILPVGSQKDCDASGTRDVGKIKTQGADSKVHWREVRSGQIMGPEGAPVSSRNPTGK